MFWFAECHFLQRIECRYCVRGALHRRLNKPRTVTSGRKTRSVRKGATVFGSKPSQPEQSKAEQGDKYIIKSLLKALRVLQFIGKSPEPARLKDVVLGVSLHKTTALRYLRTLEMAGVIARDPDFELYRIDVRLAGSLNLSIEVERLRLACHPFLENLQRNTGGTVNLGFLQGMDIIYVDIVRSDTGIGERSRVGRKDPVHTTALGKAILAYLPLEARTAAMPVVLRKRTERSVIQRAAFIGHLDAVQDRGYAEEEGENEERAYCIGAPIFSSGNDVVAAVSVSMPLAAATPLWRENARKMLLETVKLLSARKLRTSS